MFITSLFDIKDLKEMKGSGIDAVVVGSTSFSIGSTLSLKLNELEECVKKAHEIELLVYVTCNIMVFNEDIDELREYLSELKKINIDGIYYSDVAVYQLALELDMIDKLIFAPGFILVNAQDAKAYLNQGIMQVELANELTLEEKSDIGVILEDKAQMVIHGYLMMSYSRRELLSNYFAEIDIKLNPKNDRDYFLVEETRENPMPILETEKGTMIYSPYILESFDEIRILYDKGIRNFRIEGLFLDKEYVLDTVQAYHQILEGMDIEEVKSGFNQKHPDPYRESGFYYQKTNLVK